MFTIRFTEDQLNFIINVVADRPFKEIHQLVGLIQQQAQQQLAGEKPESFSISFEEDQINYVIGAVADRPFKEVHQLIGSIQQQAQEQINAQQAQPVADVQVEATPTPKKRGSK